MKPTYLTTTQVAERCGVSRSTVHCWCKRDGLPHRVFIRHSQTIRMIEPALLAAWLADRPWMLVHRRQA